MNLLTIIPARGGSKGVPGKNTRLIGGKPLIAWTILAALDSSAARSDLIVSTDSEEIASVSRSCGAEVPFVRPESLSDDKATSLSVMQHAVQFMESIAGSQYDWVLLLQPTSPLRTAEDIDNAILLADATDCDSVIAVTEKASEHPRLAKFVKDGFLYPFLGETLEAARRQDCSPEAVFNNGALYLTRRNCIVEKEVILGERALAYRMPRERSIDIDDLLDFEIAELLLKRKRN